MFACRSDSKTSAEELLSNSYMGIDRESTDHHIEKEESFFLSLKFQEGNFGLSSLGQTMDAGCNIQNNLNAFFCRLDDLKTLVDLMSCLYIDVSKDSECDIEVTPESFFLRVTGKGRCVQGRVSIGLELFEEFYCDVEGVTFTVSLSNFIDCLKLFGTSLDTTTAALSFSVSASFIMQHASNLVCGQNPFIQYKQVN